MIKKFDWNRRWQLKYSATTARRMFLQNFWIEREVSQSFDFKDVSHIPILILLGEPGAGKSEAINIEYKRLLFSLKDNSDDADFIDLQGIANRSELISEIFSRRKFQDWKSGSHNLTLFLDSIDRSLISPAVIISVISNQLRDEDIARLHLRIVCRDMDWSTTIAGDLYEIWDFSSSDESKLDEMPKVESSDEDSTISVTKQVTSDSQSVKTPVQDLPILGIYQIAPLSIQDVVLAASSFAIDTENFMVKVMELNALPLATTPLDLIEMLESYIQTNQIANTRTELFKDSCYRRCRRILDSNEEFTTTLELRMRMAAQIAAVMIFSNKYWVSLESKEKGDKSVLYISEMLKALPDTPEKHERETLIRETLKTSLFVGTDNRTWIHRSIAEFLAAYYVDINTVSVEKVVCLLTGGENYIFPQLQETARWLSMIRLDVFNEVVSIQSHILMNLDFSYVPNNDFEKFMNALLSLEDQYLYAIFTDDLRERRIHINHPALAGILPGYLENKNYSIYLRRFVIALIDRFKVSGLDSSLIQIVFDTSDDIVIRRLAADAIWEVGENWVKKQLKPFIYSRDDDPDDDLKGYALLSLWPDEIETTEVFDVLSYPKRQSYFGSYKMFLSPERFVNKIPIQDIPIALKWVEKQPDDYHQEYSFQLLVYVIMQRAWENIEYPDILPAFAHAAFSRVIKNSPIFNVATNPYRNPSETAKTLRLEFIQQSDIRYKIIETVLQSIIEDDVNVFRVLGSDPPLLMREDIKWILSKIAMASNQKEEDFFIELTRRYLQSIVNQTSVSKDDTVDIDMIFRATINSSKLADALKLYFMPWRLEDPEVIKVRQEYRKTRNMREVNKLPPHDPPPLVRLEVALNAVKSGDTVQWLNVIYSLQLIPEGGQWSLQLQPDLKEFPTWKISDKSIQAEILNAAKIYIAEQGEVIGDVHEIPKDYDWFITGSKIPYIELTGYLALFHIYENDIEFLEQLPVSIWERWAKIIFWFPFISGFRTDREAYDQQIFQQQYDLFNMMYSRTQQLALYYLGISIDMETREGYIFSLRKFQQISDREFEDTLLQKIQANFRKPLIVQILLEDLLSKGSDKASILIEKITSKKPYKELLQRLLIAWMRFPVNFNWLIVWKEIQASSDLGMYLVENISDREYRLRNFAEQMTKMEIAEFIIWIEGSYPHEHDPKIDGMHTVSARENIARFRNELITYLKSEETLEARQAIEKIAETYPHYDYIQFVRAEIQRTIQIDDWIPVSPESIIELEVKKDRFWRDWTNSEKQTFLTIIGIIIALVTLVFGVISFVNEANYSDLLQDSSIELEINPELAVTSEITLEPDN